MSWAPTSFLIRSAPTESGIAYGMRVLGQRSSHTSRGSNDSPRSLGKPGTGRRGTGDVTLEGKGVCVMQSAATLLRVIQERGTRGLPLERLYRHLYNPELYLLAYGRLYSNDGAMTPGTTSETVDGMSLEKIRQLVDAVRHERHRWTPVKRVSIPKKNGKMRPLGLPIWTDKMLQEVMRSLLEAYYEPQFSQFSHGFRPHRGCHTALQEVAKTWTGTHWFIEGDISQCFDRLDHETLVAIVGERIQDNRFLRLLSSMLEAGYLEDWRWNATLSGSPQGGVISPLLANIYLSKLDEFVETTLLPRYNRGKLRRKSRPYNRVEWAIRQARTCGDRATLHHLRKQRRQMATRDPHDPDYRRLHYIRYADDFLLGFSGPREEAEEIKRQIGEFLRNTLKLELSNDKTLITHAFTDRAKFLGYEVNCLHADDKLDPHGRRGINGLVSLRVPEAAVEQRCRLYMRRGKPAARPELLQDSDFTIVSQYQSEFRGMVQYYLLAQNVSRLSKLNWVMATSLLKTLADKHHTRVSHMARKYSTTIETPHGPRKCFQVVVSRGSNDKPLVAQFGGIPLRRQHQVILTDLTPLMIRADRNELLKRLLADVCELCGSRVNIEVHHVRKLADLNKAGRREKPRWIQIMAARRRKTLVVCRPCHEAIHAGRSIACLRKTSLESGVRGNAHAPFGEGPTEKDHPGDTSLAAYSTAGVLAGTNRESPAFMR
jgi:group II intron reverse transcriptase/maturase